ncbi:MAG TPA: hypothetical protein PLR99_32510 [Polyangiaceae bacterium]|nr:hypothetical protein [Polyangiaceae bacterium]
MRYEIDLSHSTLEIFTFADGLFARLAHDLRLSVADGELSAEREDGAVAVRARVRLGALRVDGVMKDGALREGVLSADDRAQILTKMRAEVFGGAREDALVELEGHLRGASFSGTLRSPAGRSAKAHGTATTTSSTSGGKATEEVSGSFELSLRELAGHDVKGPLGAFRVSDHVRVTFKARFVEV